MVMESINHERKTIMVRWHGLREYPETPAIVGMRGYPSPNIDGHQRYELSFDGNWECHYYAGDTGSRWLPNPIYKLVLKSADFYAVIKAAEEHAYMIYHTPVADDDDEKEYAAPDENWQWQPPES